MMHIHTANDAKLTAQVFEDLIRIRMEEDTEATYLEVVAAPEYSFDGTEYVLFPGCCYKGNQFDVLAKDYPPMFSAEEAHPNMPVTITDVPRLNKDGSGMIEVTTGDVSVPCIGLYLPKENKGILLHTVQEICGVNIGLCYEKGKMMLRWPFYRKRAYRWPHMRPGTDEMRAFRKGEEIEIPYRYEEFDCVSMEQFYRVFFERRKVMGMPDELPPILPFEKQFEILRDKFNYLNWYDVGGFYGHITKNMDTEVAWQPGWCGGCLSSLGLLKLGGKKEETRAISTLQHAYRTQRECGFLPDATDAAGKEVHRGFGGEESQNWHLIRESGDVLYYTFKHFDVMLARGISIPADVEAGAKKLADAFVNLWDKYGQFGQFVDIDTGLLVVGGSTACAIAGAGLCRAYEYFHNERYLEVAKAAAKMYYDRDAAQGYTTGGPCEILQCPDHESCAGLLESLVVLYETTKETCWLEKAKHMAHMTASWAVAYNYRFPATSEFGRLDMKTVGTMYANIQNKCATPGICTYSGLSLYKLYQYTGDPMYKELFEEIVLTVSQYMSTDARPVYSWDVPKDASLLNDDSITAPPERLLPGFICERVNLSDWESWRCVGGVFNGSCWCESTNLLILAECTDVVDTSRVTWRT